jgi:RNA polymerase sigma-70 factor (ECF subfamily)
MLNNCENSTVARLKNGDLDALGELYDRFNLMVYRTALAITGDQDAASDLLQDVFLRLYRFADRIDEERPLEPWLYRMTANLSYTWVKQSRRWFHPLEDLADWIAGSAKNSPHDIVERRDDWDQVQNAVACLPVSQRVVVVLYYLNDLSLQEISEILEIPIGTVKSRLHYGRQALKKKLSLFDFTANQETLSDLHYEITS